MHIEEEFPDETFFYFDRNGSIKYVLLSKVNTVRERQNQ